MILELSKEVLSKSSWLFCWVSTKKKNLLVIFVEKLSFGPLLSNFFVFLAGCWCMEPTLQASYK